MTETKDFPVAVIASLSTGVQLCKFGDMHEAAEYLMGQPISTSHFMDKSLIGEMQRTITEQCSAIPTKIDGVTADNYLQKVALLEAEIGKTVRIRKGCCQRATS
jgi:hypothetical protein